MANILVVDDDAPAGDLVAALLRHFGHDASSACGGDAALQQLGGTTLPDLVLLDVMMPGMNGIEVLKRIRTDARTADLPVVMLSALDDEDWRARAHVAGACDYWIKGGFDVGELEERVRSRLSA